MISVRRRDDGKGLELGLGFDSGTEMDELEVEEGEACDGDDNYDEFDPIVDPDIALSYIDEKLQDVLGHFQKDFEGVVTAENLGAKFGDYGSFLPTYQRAPAWSHLRSPVKVDHHNPTTSLRKSNPKVGVHVSRRHEEASVSNGGKGTEEIFSSHCVDASFSRFELEKSYGQSSDHNIVKSFVEVGSNNLSTRKMAEIYSGPSVELSPSSLGESSGDIDCPDESPSRILQIMTSCPLNESLLLSPLNEYLINLTVKQKKVRKEGKSGVSQKVVRARPNVPGPLKSDKNNFNDKKPMSFQNDISSIQYNNLNNDDNRKVDAVVLKKEILADTVAWEKHINAPPKDAANGDNFDINVHLEEPSKIKEVNAVFSSETQLTVSKVRKTENVETSIQNAILQEENILQLPFGKENVSFGRQKKLKGTQGHNERVSLVPKSNEDNAKAVNMYKDLFGEMELDIELDTEKLNTIDRGTDDVVANKSKSAPNGTPEKKLNVEKKVRQSMPEADTKLASTAAPFSRVVGHLDDFYQVPLSSEVDKKNSAKKTNIQSNQSDQAQTVKSTTKKLQAAVNNRSVNGFSHPPLAKEVEPTLLSQTNVSEKHFPTDIENGRLFEHLSSGACAGENLQSENSSKRVHDQNGSRVSKKIRMDGLHCREEDKERKRDKLCQVNGSHPIRSVTKSLLRGEEENLDYKSEIDKGKAQICESSKESINCTESHDKVQNIKSSKIETKLVAKKKSMEEGAKESSRSESRTKLGENNVLGVKVDPASIHAHKQNHFPKVDESSLEKQIDKVVRGEVSEKGKSHSLPPSGKGCNEFGTHSRHLNREDHNKNGVNNLSTSASEGDNALDGLKQKKSPNSNGINHKAGFKDVAGFGKRDPSSHAASIALKEAKDLKHMADRLKGSGSSAEATGFYFEAALKFLHGASLLESSTGETAKQNETNQSMHIYSSTGKLCGFCAYEYEKSKDMATAALAYKCMEVAYMRVIYSSRGRASRDRLELQAASQIGVPGESPLSSASDFDSINNPKSDKIKGFVSSSQVSMIGNHAISTGDRSSFVRLLSYAQDVNFAMEASRKCKIAFAAANQRLEMAKHREEGMASVKRALDFNFQDVEGLLRLVRLAMEAISR